MLRRICLLTLVAVGLITSVGGRAFAAVHPGDELVVTVYEHPELTGPVAVDTTERISLPLAGMIHVHGLDTHGIAQRIQLALGTYIWKPAVVVALKSQLLTIFVSGGPGGTLKYEPGETLIGALGSLAPLPLGPTVKDGTIQSTDAVAELGRSRSDFRHVGIERDGSRLGTYDAIALSSAGMAGPTLQPGDQISFVDKPNAVRVSGQVGRPGFAYLNDDEPLSDAIAQVGGVLPAGSTWRVGLERGGTTQLLSLSDERFNAPGKNGDAITVPLAARVNVAGLVEKPGATTLKTDVTLLSALYEAGGPTKFADLANVQVLSDRAKASYDITKLVHGDLSQNPTLHDGDVVFVPEGRKIVFRSIFEAILSVASLRRL